MYIIHQSLDLLVVKNKARQSDLRKTSVVCLTQVYVTVHVTIYSTTCMYYFNVGFRKLQTMHVTNPSHTMHECTRYFEMYNDL